MISIRKMNMMRAILVPLSSYTSSVSHVNGAQEGSFVVTPCRGRASTRNVEILLIFFRYSCIPTNESLFILLALPTLAQTVQTYDNLHYIYFFFYST
jgi:hypothetical protein